MQLVLCPGIHPPELTEQFLAGLTVAVPELATTSWLQYPDAPRSAYDAGQLLQFLQRTVPNPKETLGVIAFSAGVVGAVGAAHLWHHHGGTVRFLLALDGWGVPLTTTFPAHRLSHDHFTHWSSALLGAGKDGFYADPAVDHLDLWRSPQSAHGWHTTGPHHEPRHYTTAAAFIGQLLTHYCDRPMG